MSGLHVSGCDSRGVDRASSTISSGYVTPLIGHRVLPASCAADPQRGREHTPLAEAPAHADPCIWTGLLNATPVFSKQPQFVLFFVLPPCVEFVSLMQHFMASFYKRGERRDGRRKNCLWCFQNHRKVKMFSLGAIPKPDLREAPSLTVIMQIMRFFHDSLM